MNKHEFEFVDGLRGLAALQVVLLHYTSAFLPVFGRVDGVAHYAWESALARSPLFVLIDGYSAVYLFFVMSGFVLAGAFTKALPNYSRLAARRFLRLYMPLCAAFAVALVLAICLPAARQSAAATSGSAWLSALATEPLSLASVAHDLLLSSMLVGYMGTSLWEHLPALAVVVSPMPIAHSLNAPMWTLHVEFWGSLLVLVLVAVRRTTAGGMYAVCLIAAMWALGPSHYALFVFGFVLYQVHGQLLTMATGGARVSGCALVLCGLYVCTVKDVALVDNLLVVANRLAILKAYSFHWQSQVGAMLVFLGLMLAKPLRAWLGAGPVQWLGRVSFSVYLLHFPIMLTVGCAVFVAMAPISYALACVTATAAGVTATYLGATWFERHVDARATQWSHRVTRDADSVETATSSASSR